MKSTASLLSTGSILAVACLCAGGPVQASTSTMQQNVKAQLNNACTVTTILSMTFGSLAATSDLSVSQANTVGRLTTTCLNGTAYVITAGNGNNFGGASPGRRMVNGSGQYLSYQLYSDAGRTTPFPDSGVSNTGTGSGQTAFIYGRVPAQTAGGFGDFTDSVTVSVTY